MRPPGLLSRSSTHAQSFQHSAHSPLCCSAHSADCNGWCENLDGSHKASQELLLILMSFNLPAQRHHQHWRVALLQRTDQNFHPAGGEHVPHRGWCTRPQDLSPTQGERPDSSEVPELPLWPRPGPPGISGVGQSLLSPCLIRNHFDLLVSATTSLYSFICCISCTISFSIYKL